MAIQSENYCGILHNLDCWLNNNQSEDFKFLKNSLDEACRRGATPKPSYDGSVASVHRAFLNEIIREQYPDKKFKSHENILTHLEFVKEQLRAGPRSRLDKTKLTAIYSQTQKRIAKQLPAEVKNLRVEIITADNFLKFTEQIEAMERRVYEPARVTSLDEYKRCLMDGDGIAIALCTGETLIGMICGGATRGFGYVGGLKDDPYFCRDHVEYILAATVDPKFQGYGLGRILKNEYCFLAMRRGIERIEGRNRDRLARTMLLMNLSLGAIELFRLKKAYLDDSPYDSAIIYSLPLGWKKPSLDLSSGIDRPLNFSDIDDSFIDQNWRRLLGFPDYDLSALERVLPKDMPSVFVARSRQECIENLNRIAKDRGFTLKIVEPVGVDAMMPVPRESLIEIKTRCRGEKTWLVYDETASQAYRYSPVTYFAATDATIKPDIMIAHLGGGATLLLSTEDLGLEGRRWTGESYAVSAYSRGYRAAIGDPEAYQKLTDTFQRALEGIFKSLDLNFHFKNGCGWVSAELPEKWKAFFTFSEKHKRYIICSDPTSMNEFLNEVAR